MWHCARSRHFVLGLLLLAASACAPRTDDRSRLYNEDGVQLFAKGDFHSALESFDMALTINPDDPAVLFNLGQCYDRLGDRPKAEKYYDVCLQRSPNHGDSRLALVSLYHRTNRSAKANTLIEEWLAKEPKLADPYVLDAWRLRQENNLPLARERLQQALSLEPNNRRALTEMATLYEAMGMPERAYVLYERILAREPAQAEIAEKLQQLKHKGVKRPLPD